MGGSPTDTIWYRTDISSDGKVQSVFPMTYGLVDDGTERRIRTWLFVPAGLNGRPIGARIPVGVPVVRGLRPRGIDPEVWSMATTRSGAAPILLATDSLILEELRSGGAPWDTIRLRVFAGTDGTVRGVRVVRSVNGNDPLAVAAARRSRYRPSVRQGMAVAAWTEWIAPVSRSRRRPMPPSGGPIQAPQRQDGALPDHGEFVYYEDPPVNVEAPAPVYPEQARRNRTEGTVVLHVLVGADGRVKTLKVIRSVPGLDEAATAAVSKWVYKPALSNNRPVAVWIEVSIPVHP